MFGRFQTLIRTKVCGLMSIETTRSLYIEPLYRKGSYRNFAMQHTLNMLLLDIPNKTLVILYPLKSRKLLF